MSWPEAFFFSVLVMTVAGVGIFLLCAYWMKRAANAVVADVAAGSPPKAEPPRAPSPRGAKPS